ncbi:MAG: hypothetical protein CME10_00075 [Gemmatimonadetes bacterium]|nr:hypothetical protein [Gemmatimonadota bacterium]
MYIAQTQDTAQYRFPFSFIKYCLLFTTVPLDPSPRRENKKKIKGFYLKKVAISPVEKLAKK